MPNDLELLLKLQVIDYDLGELERSKEYLPDMMENLNREIRESQEKLSDAQQRYEAAKVRQKTLELDVKTHETNLARYQQQMMTIKTNKEYDALIAEIDSIKSAVSARETELLETIETISVLEKDIATLSERRAQIEENNSKQLAILQEKVNSIGDKISQKVAFRQEVISTISRPTLSTYERVRKGKGGQAVVAVRSRACGSCYRGLTPKKIQEIKRGDRIYTCDNCGSMLFWDDGESA